MRVAGFFFGLLCLSGVSRAGDVPGIVIVPSGDKSAIVDAARKGMPTGAQARTPGTPAFDRAKFENSLVPLSLVEVAAFELEEDGRLTPIAWLLTDPIFRAAVEDRLIPTPSFFPPLAEVQAAMPKLRVGYALFVGAFVSEGRVWTTASLYRGQKEIWKDEVRNWDIQTQSQFDSDNAKRSIARTWVQVLGSGPFKDIPQRKRAATPDPVQGTGPHNDVPVPPPPADNKQLLLDSMKLLASNNVPEAVNLLRDAVDAAPADLERREALVSALLQAGEPELAAREARRAASLLPEKVALWVLAARAWIAAGKQDEAVQDLNEAVTRDPEGRETRLLLGEMQVAQHRFPLAVEHLSKVLESQPSAYTLRLRGFAYAAQGMEREFQSDLQTAEKSEAAESPVQLSGRAAAVLKATFALGEESAARIRTLIQRVRVAPGAAEHGDEAAALRAKLKCLSSYFAECPSDPKLANSLEHLVLALKLLALSVADLTGSLDKLDEDALTEAAINLGEGLKALGDGLKALGLANSL